eukprot:TRINITY_DN2539_c0_g1_i1.p1 TRINITY_DN2539_c0_g1~~TRINITY_DN2539_c0_g1_i1.p1  ORF type:complete len:518 (+),score=105.33 TRINITY_DN2539_c0_g1_i1:1146-2699(+)
MEAPRRHLKSGLDTKAAAANRRSLTLSSVRDKRSALISQIRQQTVQDLNESKSAPSASNTDIRELSTAVDSFRACLSARSEARSALIQQIVSLVVDLSVFVVSPDVEPVIQSLAECCAEVLREQPPAPEDLLNVFSILCTLSSREQTSVIVAPVCSAYVIAYMDTSNALIREQATLIVGNIAADSKHLRGVLIEQGILPPLIRMISSDANEDITCTAIWALCNLCRGISADSKSIFSSGIHESLLMRVNQALSEVSKSFDPSTVPLGTMTILAESAWVFSFFTAHESQFIMELLRIGVLPSLMTMLGIGVAREDCIDANLATPVLRALGNIGCVLEDDAHFRDFVSNEVFLKCIGMCISHSGAIAREALWALCNVVSCPPVLQTLSNCGFVDQLLNLVENRPAFEIFLECMYIINRIFHILINSGDGEGFSGFVCGRNFAVGNAVVDLLSSPSPDAIQLGLRMSDFIMGRLPGSSGVYMMEERGIIDLVENARECNDELYGAAEYIMDKYFGETYGQ